VGDKCHTSDASPLGTRCSTHKLVKWYCELILNPQDTGHEHLLIIFGNRDINGVLKNQIWRVKTNEELDKLIKHKNIINHIKAKLVWSHTKDARYQNS